MLDKPRPNDNFLVLVLFLYLGAVVMWMAGSFTLAKAKGYEGDMVGGVFMFLLILGCCFPIAPLLFPGVVIFALKDKTRGRRRRH